MPGITGVANLRTRRVGQHLHAARTHALAVPVVHAVGTQASVSVLGRPHTDIRTRRVAARIRALLQAVREHLQVHQTVQVAEEYLDRDAVIFVCRVNCVIFPVVPVHLVLEDGYGERMRHDIFLRDYFIQPENN